MAIGPVPIKRDAFLYIEGPGDKQCGTCWLWKGAQKRCVVLPSDLEVNAGDTCGYWGYGAEQSQVFDKPPIFTTEEVGFVRRAVRCENCFHFDKPESLCYLFGQLNNVTSPDGKKLFDLDFHVAPNGCCNAQTPRRSRVVT